ncbi:MAG: HAMP domain-containing sensor histidine kinase [Anaerolineales bacterium]|jgi:signal transduction histidine kinase
MKKPIDMLIALKKPWLETMMSLGSSDQEGWRPSSKEWSKFWDLVSDAYLRQEPGALKPQLESWLQSYFVSEMDTGRLASDVHPVLVTLLAKSEQACFHAASERFDQEDRIHLFDQVVPLYNAFYELAAKLELDMYLHEVRRREETVRHEVQRLDETRSSFINTAAHNLKTPLTLIEGYTEMLGESLDTVDRDPDYEILMRGINTGTSKMRAIIDELIDISLVDNQMLSLYYQKVNVGELLTKLRSELEQMILDKSLEFEIQIQDQQANSTYADEERLTQAFKHVIRNAVQYTPEAGSIKIEGRSLPGFLEITCTDTGVGIAREDQAIIFEKFGRVPDSLVRRDVGDRDQTSGTGLGLHLAKGILEAHGGTIWVESPICDDEDCPGSSFHMMIPIRDQAPDISTMQRFGSLHAGRNE